MNGFWLKLRLKKRWGFVIYRIDYSSGADWTKFLEMYETFSDQGLPSSDDEDGRRDAKLRRQMSWQNNKPQFDAATIAQLRLHFREWAASENLLRQRESPELHMLMVVDKDVLDKVCILPTLGHFPDSGAFSRKGGQYSGSTVPDFWN
ncbi:hypothetical protein E4T44_04853 [Aureobasidium sp. EXF-8845]|nr:hypothetical protein E4T44_04853 [Aureobasidium sp. EXF-8845]KAI4855740.1 hypothetical protein E4T45_02811 [Aureobasidium sp. EXF-8846]